MDKRSAWVLVWEIKELFVTHSLDLFLLTVHVFLSCVCLCFLSEFFLQMFESVVISQNFCLVVFYAVNNYAKKKIIIFVCILLCLPTNEHFIWYNNLKRLFLSFCFYLFFCISYFSMSSLYIYTTVTTYKLIVMI